MPLDAHDLYSELCKSIAVSRKENSVAEALKACRNENEIIQYVRQVLDDSGLFELVKPVGDRKDDTKAVACRKMGNECFHPRMKRYVKAIEYYNECIALSEPNSETLAIAYANRSAVCFELKEYKECLENIRLALANPYPERLIPKLENRKEECLKLMTTLEREEQDVEHQREAKLSYRPNPKIPFISDCLELKTHEQFGRYLATNRNLNAGDIVAIEKPFSLLLSAKLRYLNCSFCLQDNFLTLIPCAGCSCTMFCSEDCRQKALDSFHRIECSVIKDMHFLFTKVILMALRTTTVAISTFNNNLEDLRLHIESIDETTLTPFSFDWNSISRKEVYSSIHILATNQKIRSASDLLQRSIFAIVMSEFLFKKTDLNELCRDNESHRDLIRSLIFRHVQTAPVNMHSIMFMDYSPGESEQYQQESLGCGSFPILSMINHSCAPNLVRTTLPSGHVAVLLNRPIKKGGQLFDNYGFHHCLETLSERQCGLRAQYSFKCQCEACRNNYPLYYNLPHMTIPRGMKPPIDHDELELLSKHDMKTALAKIPDYCQFLNKYDAQYPNFEISSVQEALLRCSQIVFAAQTRKLKYKGLCNL